MASDRPEHWNTNDVCAWVRTASRSRFPAYDPTDVCSGFTAHLIDGPILLGMDTSDWKELVPVLGLRKVLMQRFRENTALSSKGKTTLSPKGKASSPRRVGLRRTSAVLTKNYLARSTSMRQRLKIQRPDANPPSPVPQGTEAASAISFAFPSRSFSLDDARESQPDADCSDIDRSGNLAGEPSTPPISTPTKSPCVYVSANDAGPSTASVTRELSVDAHEGEVNFKGDAFKAPPIRRPRRFSDFRSSSSPELKPFTPITPITPSTTTTTLTTTVKDHLVSKRSAHDHVFFMPHGNGKEKTNKGLPFLFEKSQFSNVPLVDHEFVPHSGLSPVETILHRLHHHFCRVIFHIRTISRLLTGVDVLIAFLAVLSTRLCVWSGLKVDIHPSLVLTITIFPLSFAVNAAYQRRELALQFFAMLKSCTLNIYLVHRAWSSEAGLPDDFLQCSRALIENTFTKVRDYVQCPHEDEKIGHLQELYKIFAEVSMVTDLLRLAGVAPPLITRPIHDLRESLHAFEKLRVFSDYRTPSSIRAFTKLTILTSPIILGPYFAALGEDAGTHGWWTPYASCFILALFLHVLQNVQRMLENPFVSHGTIDQDDIKLDSIQAMQAIAEPETSSSGSVQETSITAVPTWTTEMVGQADVATAYLLRLEAMRSSTQRAEKERKLAQKELKKSKKRSGGQDALSNADDMA